MKEIIAKPYKLINTVQNYEWGTKNSDAFIPKFLGEKIEADKTYAELWIGTHPKAPSKVVVDGEEFSLPELIKKFPIEILGERVNKKFGSNLPFLLKVLSAGKALSIQTHPNKSQAEVLHKKDPVNYPDDNHKPEIAIAIDTLNAIVGFKPADQLIKIFDEFDEFAQLVGYDLVNKFKSCSTEENLKNLYVKLLSKSDDEIAPVINSIRTSLENKSEKSDYEKQFLNEFKEYGIDVGLFSILLFNYMKLNEDEGIFTDAGVPHAYLKGNIVECMANSDNVVRAGLTPKFKDVETLSEILDYSTAIPDILGEKEENKISYTTSAEEFVVTTLVSSDEFEKKISNNSVKIYLVTEGEVVISCNQNLYKFEKGNSIFIPANLTEYSITLKSNSKVVVVDIP